MKKEVIMEYETDGKDWWGLKQKENIVRCEHCINWKNNHICMKFSKFGTIETPPDFYCGYGDEL